MVQNCPSQEFKTSGGNEDDLLPIRTTDLTDITITITRSHDHYYYHGYHTVSPYDSITEIQLRRHDNTTRTALVLDTYHPDKEREHRASNVAGSTTASRSVPRNKDPARSHLIPETDHRSHPARQPEVNIEIHWKSSHLKF